MVLPEGQHQVWLEVLMLRHPSHEVQCSKACTLTVARENETWMNSFLFNVILILLAAVSVTQFCASAFSQYARLSAIDLIFGTQIKYLRFFTWFYANNVFVYALVVR
jgi:LMBR1 domain-containing protein 1